jgi:sarcosine oxidase subunit beta
VSYDLAVIGGGLMGLSVAVEAAREGMRVVLLEAERIGRHASGASAGGVRSLNRHPAEIPLARAALAMWRELPARIGADGGFKASGQIRVALDAAGMAALEARAALTRGLGYDHEQVVGPEALAAREPALAGRVVGGLMVEDDGFADPLASLKAYRAAAQQAGVTLREGVPVTGLAATGSGFALDTPSGTVAARRVVNAAGAWGAAIATMAGDAAPVTPRALQMTVTERLPRFAHATIGIEGHKLSLKQGAEGTVVIGGAFEAPIGADGIGRPQASAIGANLANAARLFPALRQARLVRSWAGIEGMSSDGLPVIGPSPAAPGLFHAFGFSAHGFALAPLIGVILADMLAGRETNLPLAPFSPDRFAADAR